RAAGQGGDEYRRGEDPDDLPHAPSSLAPPRETLPTTTLPQRKGRATGARPLRETCCAEGLVIHALQLAPRGRLGCDRLRGAAGRSGQDAGESRSVVAAREEDTRSGCAQDLGEIEREVLAQLGAAASRRGARAGAGERVIERDVPERVANSGTRRK